MRSLLIIGSFILVSAARGQELLLPLNDFQRIQWNLQSCGLSSSAHTGIYPVRYNPTDSTGAASNANRVATLFDASFTKNTFSAWGLPMVDLSYGKQLNPSGETSELGYGIAGGMSWKNKILLQGHFLQSSAQLPAYYDTLRSSLGILPSVGDYTRKGNISVYQNWMGTLSIRPNPYFSLDAGRGKNFLGEGYRSLFLSDNASPYPFGRITTSIWHIKYVNLFMFLQDKRNVDGVIQNRYSPKFVSLHYLSWNISKRVNLSLYESIVWQGKDTLTNRGFDVHYLNPVIFYRPVEYGLGSSDNALIGASFKVKVTNCVQLYSSLIIDEFLLSEMRADSGWWGNKYAWQAGLKISEPFKIKGLFLQGEYNMARPFTWSHGSVLQNYGHMNQPLAHPLGSNFKEAVGILHYQYKRWYITETLISYLHGNDSSAASYGGDIYRSYKDRAQDYHNNTGQGLQHHVLVNRLSAGYNIHNATGLRLEASYVYRTEKIAGTPVQTQSYFLLSLRSNLFEKQVLR